MPRKNRNLGGAGTTPTGGTLPGTAIPRARTATTPKKGGVVEFSIARLNGGATHQLSSDVIAGRLAKWMKTAGCYQPAVVPKAQDAIVDFFDTMLAI